MNPAGSQTSVENWSSELFVVNLIETKSSYYEKEDPLSDSNLPDGRGKGISKQG